MILGTSAIQQALADGAIVCDPPPARIEGAHIDVTLGEYRWRQSQEDAGRFYDDSARARALLFQPGRMYLCHTVEYIGTAPGSGLLPVMHGRSTMARLGVEVHLAAGWGDEGYASRWTMEIVCQAPIVLPVGARIACISFMRIEGAAVPYVPGTRYNATPQEWTPQAMLPRLGNW